MKIIVLGGKGFVGSAVVEKAREHGHDVMPVDLDTYDDAIGASCDVLVNANGNSRKYLAAKSPAKDFELSVSSVVRSFQDFTARLYVHLSSIDVYSDVSTPANNTEATQIDCSNVSAYGFHKHLAEELVRHFASQWLILRMAGFVGKRLWKNSVYDILKGRPIRVPLGSEYQYLNTRDVARIIFNLLDKNVENEIFNVAGDGVIALSEIAGMIANDASLSKPGDKPKERYEVSIQKIKRICAIPETRATVKAFVEDVLEGKVDLR